MSNGSSRFHVTEDKTSILVSPGKKSVYDFRVSYIQSKYTNRERTPKHIHIIVELYVKQAHNKELTHELAKHILEMYDHVRPIKGPITELQFYKPEHAQKFKELDAVGDYSAEFLLIVTELLAIEEKTNSDDARFFKQTFEKFLTTDRFRVISSASFRGKKAML